MSGINRSQTSNYPLIVMEKLRKNKVNFFLGLSVLLAFILFSFDYFTGKDFKESFWGGVLVEAHGMFLDVILFGILLTIYEKYTEKYNEIKRLEEEIDDFRGWLEPEAMYRIVGCIRRLQKLSIHEIDLSNCFLENANLSNFKFVNSKFDFAKLSGANLQACMFIRSSFSGTEIENCNLINSKFENCTIRSTKFNYSYLFNCRMDNCMIGNSDFSNSHFLFNELIKSQGNFEGKTDRRVRKSSRIRFSLHQTSDKIFIGKFGCRLPIFSTTLKYKIISLV